MAPSTTAKTTTTSAATTTTKTTTTTTTTAATTKTTARTTSTPTTTQSIITTTSLNCPFKANGRVDKTRSIYCPESYCPAVYIWSTGGAAEHQPESLGCYDYEGSLMNNVYPDYVNIQGWFLTPTAYSNPILGYTEWVVSQNVLDTGREGNGTIRNIKRNDQFCPYDMPDGWEYLDSNNRWVEDTTITVSCIRN